MPHRKNMRTSEAAREQEHGDEVLKHLPKSFQVLANFVLKGGEKDAERTRPTK